LEVEWYTYNKVGICLVLGGLTITVHLLQCDVHAVFAAPNVTVQSQSSNHDTALLERFLVYGQPSVHALEGLRPL